jgi:tetratricopeptide (TPR) repeat protein
MREEGCPPPTLEADEIRVLCVLPAHPRHVLLRDLRVADRALALGAQGKYGEAEGLLRKSLALQEKTLGVEHPSYGASLHALAGVLQAQGKFSEAEIALKQAGASAEKSLGLDHPLQRIASGAVAGPAPSGPAESLMAQIQSSPGDAAPPDWNARIHAALEQAKAGDPSAALQALVQIAEEAHKAGATGPEASARIFLGQIHLFQNGERILAAAELHRALTLAEQLGDESAAAHIRALLAQAEQL